MGVYDNNMSAEDKARVDEIATASKMDREILAMAYASGGTEAVGYIKTAIKKTAAELAKAGGEGMGQSNEQRKAELTKKIEELQGKYEKAVEMRNVVHQIQYRNALTRAVNEFKALAA